MKQGRPLKWPVDLRETICKRRAEGMPVKEITANTGVPMRSVYLILEQRLKALKLPEGSDSE